jgi:hypothetical protein
VLKQRQVDNSEIHYTAEAMIKLILMRQVQNPIKVQLASALENLLFVDSERSKEGLSLVEEIFTDLSRNAFDGLKHAQLED